MLSMMSRPLSDGNPDVSSAFLGHNIKSSFKGHPGYYGVLHISFHPYPITTSQVILYPSFIIISPGKGLLTPKVVAGRLHPLLIFCVVGN